MSNPDKTYKTGEKGKGEITEDYSNLAGLSVGEMPGGGMSEAGSRTVNEMPSGQMTGLAASTMAGAAAEMPTGGMTGADRRATGTMPGGGMIQAATDTMIGLEVATMPKGEMSRERSMPSGEMAVGQGQSIGVAGLTMVGLTTAQMPSGKMTGMENAASEAGGDLSTLEIAGDFKLILTPTSCKGGSRS